MLQTLCSQPQQDPQQFGVVQSQYGEDVPRKCQESSLKLVVLLPSLNNPGFLVFLKGLGLLSASWL